MKVPKNNITDFFDEIFHLNAQSKLVNFQRKIFLNKALKNRSIFMVSKQFFI
jgi:hypothetical protein